MKRSQRLCCFAMEPDRPEELVIDRHVIAVASDVPLNLDVALLDINDVEGLADFVVEWMQKQNG